MKIKGSQLRIMAENLLKTNMVSMTTSKIKSGYSLEDLTSYNRNIHFAFAGTFLIDENNEELTIDGNTYNIPVGEYKRSDLIIAINTLINADGFTLSWANGYFTVSSSAEFDLITSGGDEIFKTLGFNDLVDYIGVLSVDAVASRFHYPCEWIEIDFGYTPDIGFMGMVSSSLKEFTLTSNAKIKIMASQVHNFDVPAFEGYVDEITKSGVFQFLTDDDYDFRFWRIEIEDNENINDVELGYLYLGEVHTFKDDYNDQKAVESYTDLSEIYKTENGSIKAFERQVQKTYGPIVFKMSLPETRFFLNDLWKRFKTIRPFFISIDPKVEITHEIDELTFLCSFKSSPTSMHYAGNRSDLTFEVDEWL